MLPESIFAASAIKPLSAGFLCKYLFFFSAGMSAQFWLPYFVDITGEDAQQNNTGHYADTQGYKVSQLLIHDNRTHIEFRMSEEGDITEKTILQRIEQPYRKTHCQNHLATQAQTGNCNSHYIVVMSQNRSGEVQNSISQQMECNTQGCWATVINLKNGDNCLLEKGEPLPEQLEEDRRYLLGMYNCSPMKGTEVNSEGGSLFINSAMVSADRPINQKPTWPKNYKAARYATIKSDSEKGSTSLVIVFWQYPAGASATPISIDPLSIVTYAYREDRYDLLREDSRHLSYHLSHFKHVPLSPESSSTSAKYRIRQNPPANAGDL